MPVCVGGMQGGVSPISKQQARIPPLPWRGGWLAEARRRRVRWRHTTLFTASTPPSPGPALPSPPTHLPDCALQGAAAKEGAMQPSPRPPPPPHTKEGAMQPSLPPPPPPPHTNTPLPPHRRSMQRSVSSSSRLCCKGLLLGGAPRLAVTGSVGNLKSQAGSWAEGAEESSQ